MAGEVQRPKYAQHELFTVSWSGRVACEGMLVGVDFGFEPSVGVIVSVDRERGEVTIEMEGAVEY